METTDLVEDITSQNEFKALTLSEVLKGYLIRSGLEVDEDGFVNTGTFYVGRVLIVNLVVCDKGTQMYVQFEYLSKSGHRVYNKVECVSTGGTWQLPSDVLDQTREHLKTAQDEAK